MNGHYFCHQLIEMVSQQMFLLLGVFARIFYEMNSCITFYSRIKIYFPYQIIYLTVQQQNLDYLHFRSNEFVVQTLISNIFISVVLNM